MLTNIITELLAKILDGFKQKNPVVFTVVAVVLLCVYYITGVLVDQVNPDGSSFLPEALEAKIEVARNLLVAVLTLIGAHTPKKPELSNPQNKQ